MTEAEWNECADPTPMLEFLRGKASDRRLRLFTCSCCRSRWADLPDVGSRNAVEVAECFADGLADARELEQVLQSARLVTMHFQALARRSLEEARGKQRHFVKTAYAVAGLVQVAEMAAWQSSLVYPYPRTTECGGGLYDGMTLCLEAGAYASVFQANCDLLRDIIGPLLFRTITLDPSWLTPTVKQLAEAIYQERAFTRLPILADALEDAGCNQPDILGHLRSGGEHCRGCWAVDLILGKE